MSLILTPHQQEKGDEIMSLLRQGIKRIALIGSAGVGKTTLASWLIDQIMRDHIINAGYSNGLVYVTAPTNKALAVLQSKITASVEFKTIHSALRLIKYDNPKTGERSFIQGKNFWKNNDFVRCKAAIIDEASMLNSQIEGNNLDEDDPDYIKGYLRDFKFPIIYIGDNKQLNPVGEKVSPVFTKNYVTVELTEIVRQGEGNPIIELSRDLDMIFFKQPNVTSQGKGYTYSEARKQIIDNLAEVNGTDDLKYLTWTNVDVDSMNIAVRQKRYGNPKKIEKLETIVFNSPFGEFWTNKEVKTEDVEIVTDNAIVPKITTRFDFQGNIIGDTDSIRIQYYKINDKILVVHENSEFVYKNICATLKENCKKYGWDWRGYYFFAEQFADIKYNHAITVHKSQGSTYKQAIINIGNIMFNKQAEERERMLYTAVTRPSDLLILNNVK